MRITKSILMVALVLVMSACASRKATQQAAKPKKVESRELTEAQRMEVDYFFFNGQKEKLIGNYGVAENLFVEVIKRDPANAQAHYEVARTSLARQQLPRALQYAATATELDPSNPWYLRLQADLLRQLGKQEEAIAALKQLSGMPGEDRTSVLLDVAMLYGEADKFKEAIKVLNEIEKTNGPAPELSEQKRQYWMKLEKPEEALAEIRALAEAFPLQDEYKLYLGQLYFEQGDFENARKQFEAALLIKPDQGKVYLALADTYRAKRNNAKAVEMLKKAFDYPDVDIDSKVQVMLSLFEDFDKNPAVRSIALDLSQRTTELHPDEAKAWAIRGDLQYHTQDFQGAVVSYKKAIDNDQATQKFTVWQQYLFALLETQQFERLSEAGAEAADLFPNQPVPFYLGGIAHLQEKRYQPAIDLLKAGVRIVYGNPTLEAQFYASMGEAYHQLELYSESDASFDKSLRLQPENALVLNNYSYYLSLRKSQLLKAEEMSRKSLLLEPRSGSYLDTYGWILYQLGRYQEAADYLEKAMSAAGGDVGTLLEHYGDIQYRLGNTEEAVHYWERALKAGGDVTDLLPKKLNDQKLYE